MDEDDIEIAPPILYLKDKEKFHDNDGNVCDIETRGERKHNKIFFLVKDISQCFNLPNLNSVLLHKDNGYEKNIDYKCFYVNTFNVMTMPNDQCHHKKHKPMSKKLYVTYQGALRILFCSRSGNANKFMNWVLETLFTAQMGTIEAKEKLTSDLLGVPTDTLRCVLNTSATHIPCIYMISLGRAKDLRDEMKLPEVILDNHIVIKYGFTDSLERCVRQHVKAFDNIKGADIKLYKYCYVDPHYLSQAETHVKNYFNKEETFIKYNSYKELVAINSTNIKYLDIEFRYLHENYSDKVKILIDQNSELKKQHRWELHEKDMKIEIKKSELKNKDIELKNKDKELELMKEIHEHDLKVKDSELEVLKLKLQIAERIK